MNTTITATLLSALLTSLIASAIFLDKKNEYVKQGWIDHKGIIYLIYKAEIPK